MNGVTSIKLGPKYLDKLHMLEELAKLGGFSRTVLLDKIAKVAEWPLLRLSTDLGTMDTVVKNGGNLCFEQAFCGMILVLCATNNLIRAELYPEMPFEEAVAKGSYFLTLMAFKEAAFGLTSEEIAGMVAAGSLDIVFTPQLAEVIETCGMGADRGWGTKALKTINASTLSALVCSAAGYTTQKHGSYGNTTKIGSTDFLEIMGANIVQTRMEDIALLLEKCRFWFTDAHSVKTLHYLSHLLMVETVNHIVGPMTPPIGPETKLYKVMGVNHNVHPAIIAKAYIILHQRGFVNLGGTVIVGGVDKKPFRGQKDCPHWFKDHSYLDEISPTATIVATAVDGEFLGMDVLEPARDFGIQIDERAIKVPNELASLQDANLLALRGVGEFGKYLACNAALALWARDPTTGKGYLRHCYQEAFEVIESGRALDRLFEYIEITKKVT